MSRNPWQLGQKPHQQMMPKLPMYPMLMTGESMSMHLCPLKKYKLAPIPWAKIYHLKHLLGGAFEAFEQLIGDVG